MAIDLLDVSVKKKFKRLDCKDLLIKPFSFVIALKRAVCIPRGYLTKFDTGRLRPEVQPLTLWYTILAEKVLPLFYTFYCEKVPLFHTYCLEHCTPFLSLCNEVNEQYYGRILSITRRIVKQNDKCYLFSSRCETTDFPALLYTSTFEIPTLFYIPQLVKSLPPFIYLKPEKGIPFGWSLPVKAIIESIPHPGVCIWLA